MFSEQVRDSFANINVGASCEICPRLLAVWIEYSLKWAVHLDFLNLRAMSVVMNCPHVRIPALHVNSIEVHAEFTRFESHVCPPLAPKECQEYPLGLLVAW